MGSVLKQRSRFCTSKFFLLREDLFVEDFRFPGKSTEVINVVSKKCLKTWQCTHTMTVELQWLEHRWLVYHGYFEFVFESLGHIPIAADTIIF